MPGLNQPGEPAFVTVVDDDGSVRWTREVPGEVWQVWAFDGGLLAGTEVIDPADGSVIAPAPPALAGRYILEVRGGRAVVENPDAPGEAPTAIDILTGEEGPAPDAGLRGAFDHGADFGGLVGRDGDEELWRRADFRYPPLEGRFIVQDERTVVATVCRSPDLETECTYELLGIDLATGDDLWSRDDLFILGEGGDNHVLLYPQGGPWRMHDMRTGEPIAGQEWPDLDAFYSGCCGEAQYRHTSRHGGTVVVVDETEVRIWFPVDRSTDTKRVRLS